ncbi:hypothetical protein GH714_020884 [Hevea brasiliensis]|uniref:Peptidase A2 domain-containing protein n=1 Tax=Hevea brasiliensis TaxID=3981 RepID=A0A6A6LB52_HEVBR|nr:hypothetical protein GH714_020884 [Hevea brasiliensis]
MEVERRGADNLASAIAIAESLVEYKSSDKDKEKNKGRSKPYKEKSGGDSSHNSRPTYNKEGGSKKFKEHKKQEGPSKGQHFRRHGDRPPLKCFLCDGPHRAWDCPKKASLSALVEQASASPQPKEGASMGSLQLAAIQAKPKEATKEKMGRFFVQASLGGKEVRALVDTGASDNFLKLEEAQRLGIRYSPEMVWLKAVNSNPSPIHGVTRDVPVKLGEWHGNLDFSIVSMDDYPCVLGVDFMDKVKAIPIPLANCWTSWCRRTMALVECAYIGHVVDDIELYVKTVLLPGQGGADKAWRVA